jgi:molybdopterin-guanine dinucleotide biosynthesis protein A
MKSAVILAGGKSRRMGRNKALLDFGGERLIQRVHRILKGAFDEVLISAPNDGTYGFLSAPVVPDVYESGGSLAGIHAGLLRSRSESCFFVACDMPFLNIELIRYLDGFTSEYDLVIPMSRNGLEPLHAFYAKSCLPHMERQLKEGNLKVIDFFDRINVREVTVDEAREYDPDEMSYFNINTQEKFELAVAKLEQMKVR